MGNALQMKQMSTIKVRKLQKKYTIFMIRKRRFMSTLPFKVPIPIVNPFLVFEQNILSLFFGFSEEVSASLRERVSN